MRSLFAVFLCVVGFLAGPPLLNAQSGTQFEVGMQVYGADATPPSVPGGVTNTVLSSVPQVTVSWTASTDNQAVSYYNVFKESVFLASTSLLSLVDGAVTLGNTYRYTVSAVDLVGNESVRSATTTAVVSGGGGGGGDTSPPTVPQNLVGVVNATTPSITLSWSASVDAGSGVDGYKVYRNGVEIADTSLTVYIDLNIAYDVSYTYTVSAYDGEDNESAKSNSYQATVPSSDSQAPSIPTGLAATVSTSTPSVLLTWNAATDNVAVSYYTIYRGGSLFATTTSLSRFDLTVATGTTYSYTVSATDAAGNQSAQSSPVSADLTVAPPGGDTNPPSVPQNLTATPAATPSVSLTWSPSTDAEGAIGGYRVYRDGALFVSVGTTSYVDLGVTNGSSYSYRVAAYDLSGNESARSLAVIATVPGVPPVVDVVPPSTPTGLSGSADADDPSVLLTWNAATDDVGVAGYRIYRAGVSIGESVGLSYTDSSVINNATYSYRVAAFDAAGNESSRSAPADVYVPEADEEIDDEEVPDEPDDETPDDTGGDDDDQGGGGDDDSGGSGGGGSDNDDNELVDLPDSGVSVPSIVRETARETVTTITREINRTIDNFEAVIPDEPEDRALISIGTAVTGLVVPAIEIASAGSSFWYLLLARLQDLGRLISWLFPWAGVRRRKNPWGTVYDSVTKQPLDPAVVELINADTNESVTSAITDLDGRFGFSVDPGRYVLKAAKTNYIFPSKRLQKLKEDVIYQNLYFGEEITRVKDDEKIIVRDIPMDPTTFDWNEFEKKRLGVMKFYSQYDLIITYISSFLFYLGFAFSVIVLYISSTFLNVGIVVVYLLVILLRKLFMKPVTKGRVIDGITKAPLSYATLKVFLPDGERPTKTVVADELGRYYLLVRPNVYQVVIEEQQEDGTYKPIYRSDPIDAKAGVIDERFTV